MTEANKNNAHPTSNLGSIFFTWWGPREWRILQVVVITGDNKLTAEAICREIGIFAAEEPLEGKSMTGRQFVELSPAERRRILQVHLQDP